MNRLTKRLFWAVLAAGLAGCAGQTLKYSHNLDNLPDDPDYFAADATISPNSKLVPRKVTVLMSPAHKTIQGADDPKPYEDFRNAYEYEYLPKFLTDNCPFTKNGNGLEGVYFVDADIEAVLFSEQKESRQMIGSLLFAQFAGAVQDQKMVKAHLSVYDSTGKLVAAHQGDPQPVMQAPFLSKEKLAATSTIFDVVKLCGMMQASHTELAKRNGQAAQP